VSKFNVRTKLLLVYTLEILAAHYFLQRSQNINLSTNHVAKQTFYEKPGYMLRKTVIKCPINSSIKAANNQT